VAVPGRGEMFVREAGREEGPTILLLHGWTASADTNWWRVYGDVALAGRLVAVDQRGHGRGIRSDERFSLEAAADDAAGLLEHLGAAPAVAVGYSMGGAVAMLLWHRHPQLVSGLVLEATALEWRAHSRERLFWRFMAFAEYLLRFGASGGLMERWIRGASRQVDDIARYRGWLKGESRRGDPEALADAGRALGRYDARPFAGRIDVPTAVVVTTHDRLVRPRKQRQLARAVPGAVSFDLVGGHDAALVLDTGFRATTMAAVEHVLGRMTARARPAAGWAGQQGTAG